MAKVFKYKNNNYLYGTIIEKGSNTNGNYIKYSDGTLIQYGSKEFTNINITTAYGYTFYSSLLTIYFPTEFYDSNYSVIDISRSSGITGTMLNGKYTTRFLTTIYNASSWSGANFEINWYAIGKWR